MKTFPTKLLAAAGLSAALLATAGLGLHGAAADQPKQDSPPVAPAKADPVKKPPGAMPAAATDADVRTRLALPAGNLSPVDAPLKDVLDQFHAAFGVSVRLDTAEFKRLNPPAASDGGPADEAESVLRLYDQKVRVPVTRGMTAGDLLTEVVAQLPGRIGYRVRGHQVLIAPAYVLPATPGGGVGREAGTIEPQVEYRLIPEQVAGMPVSISVDEMPLAEVLRRLRQLTGANIVLDARCREKAREPVSGTFDDARLFTVLTVLSDMCGLKTAYTNNVYYVTSPENAERVQRAFFRDLYGDPTAPSVSVGGLVAPTVPAVAEKK